MPGRLKLRAVVLLLALSALLGACAHVQPIEKPLSVLFVGNSQVYVGNLPAVFDALSASQGRATDSDMIVKGGATLKQWLDDGAVQRAMAARHYDVVVLQERGGDMLGAFGPGSSAASKDAVVALGRIAREQGAKPVLLGTYQTNPRASDALIAGEGEAAAAAGMPYIAVSRRMANGIAALPKATWFASDGMHPGHDTILLDAVLVYHHVFGQAPAATGFRVDAPMYEPSAHFLPPTPVTQDLTAADIAVGHDYDAARVAEVLGIAAGD